VAARELHYSERTAKALRVHAIEIEAYLEWHSTYEGANGVAPDPQRSGRKRRISCGPAAPQADHTSNRTVGVDTALSGRPFKASEREQVANDKAMPLARRKNLRPPGAVRAGHYGADVR